MGRVQDGDASTHRQYPVYQPGEKQIKKAICKFVLVFIGRAMQSSSVRLPAVEREVERWEDGFTVGLTVLPTGPRVLYRKQGDRLRFEANPTGQPDLEIRIKNVESALMILTAQMGNGQAYAEHRISVRGDNGRAMAFTRCLEAVEAHLFPKLVSGQILKRVPPLGARGHLLRLYLYTLGVPLGI